MKFRQVADLLVKDCNAVSLQKKYLICHDKGTFDAISLMPGEFEHFKNAYIATVKRILVDSGIFIITSCNWTEKQLLEHFKGGMYLLCNWLDFFLFFTHFPPTCLKYNASAKDGNLYKHLL